MRVCKYVDLKWLSCHAGCQEVSKCRIRGELGIPLLADDEVYKRWDLSWLWDLSLKTRILYVASLKGSPFAVTLLPSAVAMLKRSLYFWRLLILAELSVVKRKFSKIIAKSSKIFMKKQANPPSWRFSGQISPKFWHSYAIGHSKRNQPMRNHLDDKHYTV